jgi:hypothetical protein
MAIGNSGRIGWIGRSTNLTGPIGKADTTFGSAISTVRDRAWGEYPESTTT